MSATVERTIVGISGQCGCGWERMATVDISDGVERVAFTLWYAGPRETMPKVCDDCIRWRALTSQPRPISGDSGGGA